MYSPSHSNGNEHKCTILAWNKTWNHTLSIQWQRSNKPLWSTEENLYYCHKAFWKKVRVHFIWKMWAVWNNNLTMWTDVVSPSWKYSCYNGINVLPHMHWHQKGLLWYHTATLAVVVQCGHQKKVRDLWPTPQKPSLIICPTCSSSLLGLFPIDPHLVWSLKTVPCTWDEALLFCEQWKDYLRCLYKKLSILSSTVISHSFAELPQSQKLLQLCSGFLLLEHRLPTCTDWICFSFRYFF